MLRFYLDGNEVDEPLNFNEVTEHIYYSEDLSAYVLEIDGNVTFTGDEYDYIRNIFETNVCGSVTFKIQDYENAEIDFDGIINVGDVDFVPDKKYAICEIQNNNITSRIDNNKSIKCNLTAGRTKNDLEYTVTQQTITLYDPTGVNTVSREGIRIFDAFKSIISFVSDNELGFVSDYFDYNTNTDPQVYSVLMTGEEVRTGVKNIPTISFYDLFNDLNSLENLALSFEDNNIRIEDKDYFKKQTSSVYFENVEGLSQQLARETLYAKVTFGSAKTLTTYDYLQDIRFNGMQDEEYHLGGQCNTDTELNLTLGAIITDANIIQDTLPSGSMGGSGNDKYDEDVFIIHCDSSNEVVLTEKPASATDFYYNDRFTNKEIAIRWLGQIPQSIYAYLGAGNDGCYINQSVDQSLPFNEGFQPTQESPLPFNDTNSNFSIQTRWFPNIPLADQDPDYPLYAQQYSAIGVYTAPANNLYSFAYEIFTDGNNPFFIQKMHNNGSSVADVGVGYYPQGSEDLGGGLWRVFGGASFYLNTNEYVGVLRTLSIGAEVYAGSTFQCFDPLGGVWQTYDASTVYNIENQVTYPVNVEDWKEIKDAPFKAMGLSYHSGQTEGWLKDISRNLKTGKAEITLLGKNG